MISLLNPFQLALAEFPFEADETQVLYIENEFDIEINLYVKRNLRKIKKIFHSQGLEFCYIPSQINMEYLPELERKAKYMMPWITQEDVFKLINLRHLRTMELFGHVNCGGAKAGVINFDGEEYRGYKIEFKPHHEEVLFYQIAEAYGRAIRRRYGEDDEYCVITHECRVSPEIEFLLEKIRQLKPNSLERELILKAIDEVKVVSPIQITARKEIVLPRYSDVKIHLTPLQKALYLLFLKHPEGISTYDMPDYRDELIDIYNSVSRRDDNEKNIASVEKILDRYDNARNEHISKIRYAFITQFSEDIAKDYIITRNESGLLKINISPDLILWE